MSKKSVLLLFSCFHFYISHSQDSTGSQLEEVVITANRFQQKQQSTGKVVSIIPRSVIDQNSGRTIGELLIQQAGLTIIGANNNLGTNQDIYMRGAATGNTLILIDGVPAYDPSNIASTFDLNHLPLAQVERIEILKGAQSTVYGSDAVAGVINIITRKKGLKPFGGYGVVTAGSFDTYKIAAGVNGQTGKNSYQLQYQHLRSGGFSAAMDTTGKNNFDRDGYNQHIVNASYQLRLTDNIEWRINGQYGKYHYDLDATAFTDEKDFTGKNENMQLGSGLTWRYKKGTLNANINQNRSKRNYLDDSLFVGGFSTYSTQYYMGNSGFAELYINHQTSKHTNLLTGIDYRWQKTDQDFLSISAFGPYETLLSADSARANIFSAYASFFLKEMQHFYFEAGARYNRHSKYGDNITFSVNPSLVYESWKVFANYSSAFKAPSLYQLYDAAAGNPTLKAEKSITVEAGLQYFALAKKWDTRLVFFHRDIKDGIEYSFVDYRYFNNNRQQDYGIELESYYRGNKLNLGFNYTYLTGKVNTAKYTYDPNNFIYILNGDTSYNNLFRRPEHQLNLQAGYRLTNTLLFSANARFTGKRYEPVFQDSPLLLDAYQTIDIYVEYKPIPKLTIFFNLNNILNEQYADIRGYATRERNFTAGCRIAF